ncbi:MAG: class I SAM-dependent RNA methyltransferase, partial [Burkholderiaceae bacterium]|nr:class I SAM-dependent RNA methyltransferase [Burkholderiaceae bacterium]
EARAAVHAPAAPVHAGDVSFRMTDFATRNAERAGVRHAIEFKTADALQRMPPAPRGVLLMNPPYGERIEPKGRRGPETRRVAATPEVAEGGTSAREGREQFAQAGAAAEFYAALAAHWKRHYPGWTAWILSPDMKLPQALRLKESQRLPVWNGPIECRLFRFELVAGSAR